MQEDTGPLIWYMCCPSDNGVCTATTDNSIALHGDKDLTQSQESHNTAHMEHACTQVHMHTCMRVYMCTFLLVKHVSTCMHAQTRLFTR